MLALQTEDYITYTIFFYLLLLEMCTKGFWWTDKAPDKALDLTASNCARLVVGRKKVSECVTRMSRFLSCGSCRLPRRNRSRRLFHGALLGGWVNFDNAGVKVPAVCSGTISRQSLLWYTPSRTAPLR